MLRLIPAIEITHEGNVRYNFRGIVPPKAMGKLFSNQKIYSSPMSARSVKELGFDRENTKWLQQCMDARQVFHALIPHTIYNELKDSLESKYSSGLEFFPLIKDSVESADYVIPIDNETGEVISSKPVTALETVIR